MERVKFDLGEKRHVRIEIISKDGGEFQIMNARFELINADTKQIATSGECLVSDHIIDAFLSPEISGSYELRYVYQIADETWIDPVRVVVSE